MVVPHITVGLETVRAATVLADVRFVGDFPITNPRSAFPVMTHQIENQLLPLGVIVRLDDVVVDLGKERARFEAEQELAEPARDVLVEVAPRGYDNYCSNCYSNLLVLSVMKKPSAADDLLALLRRS